tara:strand:- start:584 stop:1099 length:516 start_codon:yes stop_codon:yes gene_type:complete
MFDDVELNKKISKELSIYIDKFHLLTSINVGDKIGKYNDKYYIEETGTFQRFKRWWQNEGRKKTFTYLDEDFKEFFKFSNKINTHDSKNELLKFITDIIPGLYNLKKTYEEEKDDESDKLKCKIDSIILTIIDLKEQISNMRINSEPKGIRLYVPPETPTSSLCCLQSCSI